MVKQTQIILVHSRHHAQSVPSSLPSLLLVFLSFFFLRLLSFFQGKGKDRKVRAKGTGRDGTGRDGKEKKGSEVK
jgi:hypothetical protein